MPVSQCTAGDVELLWGVMRREILLLLYNS